jgi:hypothetical protein
VLGMMAFVGVGLHDPHNGTAPLWI